MTENLDQLREEMRTHAGLGWDHQPVAFEVLEALIDRVEAAEQAVERAKAVDALQRRDKGALYRRAEAAEAAVQRVRKAATGERTAFGWGGAMDVILRALDGGEQE